MLQKWAARLEKNAACIMKGNSNYGDNGFKIAHDYCSLGRMQA
jgi:hypothetical protein